MFYSTTQSCYIEKTIEAIKNIKCHQTEQERSLMLPSRAIGKFLFPTYEVMINVFVIFKCYNVGKNKM